MAVGFSKQARAGVDAAPTVSEEEAARVRSDPLTATTLVAQPLSRRELEVLHGVAGGLSDKQVAGRLGISPKTVRNHLSTIFTKLGAANRVEAVIRALRSGLLNL